MRAFLLLIAPVVCLAAADAQIRPPRPTPDGIREQIAALSAPDPVARAFAACYLAGMGRRAEAAVPALIRVLADATPIDPVACQGNYGGGFTLQTGRKSSPGLEAAGALGAIGSNTAIDPLLQAIRGTNRDVKRNVAHALGLLQDPRSVEALIAASRDADALVRTESAVGLGRQRDPRGIAALITLLKDADDAVRWEAAAGLGRVRDPQAVEPLIASLADAAPLVRERAIAALGTLRDARAVAPLIPLMKDADPVIRERAAIALGTLADPRASEPLIAALKDEDPLVREQAARAPRAAPQIGGCHAPYSCIEHLRAAPGRRGRVSRGGAGGRVRAWPDACALPDSSGHRVCHARRRGHGSALGERADARAAVRGPAGGEHCATGADRDVARP
jgi:HEAT repeat protein